MDIEKIENIASAILIIVTAGFIFITTMFQVCRESDNSYVKRYVNRYQLLKNLDEVYRFHLQQWFRFYNELDQKGRLCFERRVQQFIDMKQFIPRGGAGVITNEMKAMVAGCAIQLTYGYPDVYFRHFWRILIYPDNYYSTISKRYHKGDVNIGGLIVLSWKSFMEGFSNPSDGKNLGLHEMAHALRLINIVENPEYDFYDRDIMTRFDQCAAVEVEKIVSSPGGSSFFREYCVTNKEEFFAVAVEYFFEKPVEFRSYNPVLYSLLARILKIDTAAMYSETAGRIRA